jgi:hypothetical protein
MAGSKEFTPPNVFIAAGAQAERINNPTPQDPTTASIDTSASPSSVEIIAQALQASFSSLPENVDDALDEASRRERRHRDELVHARRLLAAETTRADTMTEQIDKFKNEKERTKRHHREQIFIFEKQLAFLELILRSKALSHEHKALAEEMRSEIILQLEVLILSQTEEDLTVTTIRSKHGWDISDIPSRLIHPDATIEVVDTFFLQPGEEILHFPGKKLSDHPLKKLAQGIAGRRTRTGAVAHIGDKLVSSLSIALPQGYARIPIKNPDISEQDSNGSHTVIRLEKGTEHPATFLRAYPPFSENNDTPSLRMDALRGVLLVTSSHLAADPLSVLKDTRGWPESEMWQE